MADETHRAARPAAVWCQWRCRAQSCRARPRQARLQRRARPVRSRVQGKDLAREWTPSGNRLAAPPGGEAGMSALRASDCAGAALFGQRRVGYLGRPFTLWKLRSMYHQSSQDYHLQVAHDWFQERNSGGRYKTESDPRVTRVGKYLRRSSLDELPQLLNVLRGEMSLVGPRPMMHYDPTE